MRNEQTHLLDLAKYRIEKPIEYMTPNKPKKKKEIEIDENIFLDEEESDQETLFSQILFVEDKNDLPIELEKIKRLHIIYSLLYQQLNIHSTKEVTRYKKYIIWHTDKEAEIDKTQKLSVDEKIVIHERELANGYR